MKKLSCMMVLLLSILVFCSCSNTANTAEAVINAPDDIFTYKSVDFDKTVITIGKYGDNDITELEKAIEKRFPDVDIVAAECAGGQDMVQNIIENGKAGKLEDMVLTWDVVPENDCLYDLSGENFSGKYNLSALESASVDGKLYQLPLSSSVSGIFYNKTLFEKHGWKVPATLDEFYQLCSDIEAENIRAFVPCFKYGTTIQRVGIGLSHDQVLENTDKALQLEEYAKRSESCKGVLEPALDVISTLSEKGLVVPEDYGSSATQNRLAMYEGEIAMIPYDYSFASFYDQEKPNCEIGMFGYPTEKKNERYMDMSSSTSIALSAEAMKDEEKKELLLDILDYISTDDGQEVLFKCISGISNVTSYQSKIHTRFNDMKKCIAEGRCYDVAELWDDAAVPYFSDFSKGKYTRKEMIKVCDKLPEAGASDYPNAPDFATASEEFTVLDTSCYYADVMRKETKADIGLMFNRSYYGGNLGTIHKGEISVPDRFYVKGLTEEDYLTTYGITGKKLKQLLEHPMINGVEVVELYAVSGLKVEYAPWAKADENVVSVTLDDGTKIEDDATYTVAAWGHTVDNKYIDKTIKAFKDVGTAQDMMVKAVTEAGTIEPAKDERITLNWKVQ